MHQIRRIFRINLRGNIHLGFSHDDDDDDDSEQVQLDAASPNDLHKWISFSASCPPPVRRRRRRRPPLCLSPCVRLPLFQSRNSKAAEQVRTQWLRRGRERVARPFRGVRSKKVLLVFDASYWCRYCLWSFLEASRQVGRRRRRRDETRACLCILSAENKASMTKISFSLSLSFSSYLNSRLA